MFRLLFCFVFLLAWPTASSTDHGARDPLTRAHDAAVDDAARISPLVQKRFALYAAMDRCGLSDNQYAFNLALSRFKPAERFLLQKAATAGWQDGVGRAEGAALSCESAVDQLRAADDALLAQAELLPDRD